MVIVSEQFSLRLDMLHTQYQLVNQSKATHNSITDRKRKLLKEYVNVCIEMRETIASRLVDYDATAMTVGLVLITVVRMTLSVCVSSSQFSSFVYLVFFECSVYI